MRTLPLASATETRRLLLTLVALSFAPALRAMAQEPVLLRLRPPVGQVSRYRTATRTVMEIPMMGVGDTATVMCMYMTQSVVAAEGDVRLVRAVVDSVVSDAPGAAAMQAALRGTVATTRQDARGRKLPPEAGDTSAPARPDRQSSLLAGGLENLQSGLPEQAVRVGDVWSDSQTVTRTEAQGRVTVRNRSTSRLARLEREGGSRIAVVAESGTMSVTLQARETAIFTSAEGTGESAWDIDAGRLVRTSLTATGRMELAQVMAMPFRMQVTTVLRPDGAEPSSGSDTLCDAAARRAATRTPTAADSAMLETIQLAQVKSDLRNLVTAQESHYATHRSYTTRLDSLSFSPSFGVTVTIGQADQYGWNATATILGVAKTCGIFVGRAPPPTPGLAEGSPECR